MTDESLVIKRNENFDKFIEFINNNRAEGNKISIGYVEIISLLFNINSDTVKYVNNDRNNNIVIFGCAEKIKLYKKIYNEFKRRISKMDLTIKPKTSGCIVTLRDLEEFYRITPGDIPKRWKSGPKPRY